LSEKPLSSLRKALFYGVSQCIETKTALEFVILFVQELQGITCCRVGMPQVSTNLTISRPATLAGNKALMSEIIKAH
jgi:hypothetical protein